MAVLRHYNCPECNGIFKWLHHPSDEPPPHYCPLCGINLEEELEPFFVPAAPHIAKSIGKSADQVYRAMEESSAQNAAAVAEMTGEDASNMKITDAQDYLRPGDVAAKMPVPPAPPQNGQGGFQPLMGKSARDYASDAGRGAFTHAGEATRQMIFQNHAQTAAGVQRRGQIAKHSV